MSDRELNDIMSFDHVIVVHEDGRITDAPTDTRRFWAPELLDDELSSVILGDGIDNLKSVDAWDFFTTGYSGQDRYSGPIMHNSEYIGGGLERDIRETPGVYVALVSCYSDLLCIHCHDYIVENEDGTHSHKDEGAHTADHDAELLDETLMEGWAIARLKDEYVPADLLK